MARTTVPHSAQSVKRLCKTPSDNPLSVEPRQYSTSEMGVHRIVSPCSMTVQASINPKLLDIQGKGPHSYGATSKAANLIQRRWAPGTSQEAMTNPVRP